MVPFALLVHTNLRDVWRHS